MRDRSAFLLVAAGAVALIAVYASYSLTMHAAYNTMAWDLGVFDQVVWNTSEGRFFEYSFRPISYAGDHWQPALLAFVPLRWVSDGPGSLLLAQAVALGASVATLYGFAATQVPKRSAVLVAGAWAISLAVARAISFDVHMDPFAPVFAFAAMWAAARGRGWTFAGLALATLLLKEDMGLLVAALAWIAWVAFDVRRPALVLVGIAAVYMAVVNGILLPHYRGDEPSPFVARYGYLGDSVIEVVLGVFTKPGPVVEHLTRRPVLVGAAGVIASAAALPGLKPRLWPALAIVMVPPMLSDGGSQSVFGIHFMAVPAAVAFVIAVIALRDLPDLGRRWLPGSERLLRVAPVAAGWLAVAVVLWAVKSPLPPSRIGSWERFQTDARSDRYAAAVELVPEGAAVSAMSSMVPHLSERETIYQFPHVYDAEWVVLDRASASSGDSGWAGYDECAEALPAMGFVRMAEKEGVEVWRLGVQRRAPEGLPEACAKTMLS